MTFGGKASKYEFKIKFVYVNRKYATEHAKQIIMKDNFFASEQSIANMWHCKPWIKFIYSKYFFAKVNWQGFFVTFFYGK